MFPDLLHINRVGEPAVFFRAAETQGQGIRDGKAGQGGSRDCRHIVQLSEPFSGFALKLFKESGLLEDCIYVVDCISA